MVWSPTSKTPDIPAPETRSPTKAKGPHRTNRINPRSVPKLQPGTHVDGNGLLLIVRPSGSRSWVQRLVVRGRRVDIGLGGFPTTSLSEARRAALDNRRVARNGGDPRKPKAAKQLTFAEAEQAAYSEQRKRWKPGSPTARHWRSTMGRYALPKLGRIPVGDIETRHVKAVLLPIAEDGKLVQAATVGRRIGTVLDWAVLEGQRNAANPVPVVLKALPKRKNGDVNHHRSIYHSRVGDALAKVRECCSPAVAAMFELMALTATRSSEARCAEWDEFDLAEKTWTIPPSRTKSEKSHTVPLSDQAMALLTELRQSMLPNNARSPYVFTGRTRNPYNHNVLRKAMRTAEVDATPHGFRAAFGSWCQDNGIDRDVRELSLAHEIGNRTEAAYARSDLLAERRIVLQRWADYVLSKWAGGTENQE